MEQNPHTQERPWYSFKEAMQARYGTPLFRVPLDAGGTCPHRAPDGSGGCAFCPTDGARAIQAKGAVSLEEQCDKAIAFARRRYHATRFMGYLQTYTNTLESGPLASGELDALAATYNMPAFTVATRPDCLTPQAVSHLKRLARTTDVYVELGIQSTSDSALAAVNRGHDWRTGREAILQLDAEGLNPVAHMILGLPGETPESMLEGAQQLGQLPLAGIKLHNLHIIRNTQLARSYAEPPFPVLSPYAYAELLLHYLQHLPENLPVLRLVTDTPDDDRLAPNWTMDKGAFTTMLAQLMTLRGVQQGDALKPSPTWKCPEGYHIATGHDGSPTVFVPTPGTHTHPPTGSIHTAEHRFIRPARLAERFTPTSPHTLLDIGAGLGTNTLCACERAAARGTPLCVTAIDYDHHLLELAARHLHGPKEARLDWTAILRSLRDTGHYQQGNITIDWMEIDLHLALEQLTDMHFDTIFFDPYPLPHNPDLNAQTFISRLEQRLTPTGTLITRKNNPSMTHQ